MSDKGWERFRAIGCMVLILALFGCAGVERISVPDEQRRVREAVPLGGSWEAAVEIVRRLGYSCHSVAVDGPQNNLIFTDCLKKIDDASDLHACLMPVEGRITEIKFGLRPNC